MYRLLYALVLRRLPAEGIHRVSFALLRALAWLPGGTPLLRVVCGVPTTAPRVHALGLEFPSPIGLAAGFDKDARGIDALLALGFGFVEIGTVTPRPQPGNPKPRMFRLVDDRALINRLGFNNGGADAVAARLRARRRRGRPGIVGVNIGKNKATADVDATADYVACATLLAPLADYLVVNVSSPNTPGLRDLQSVERLGEILRAVRAAADAASPARRVPLLVKIAPDLADADVDAIGALAVQLDLDGVIATNTTIARDGLRTPAAEVAAIGAGGLSGAPLRARALEVTRRLRAQVGPAMTIIGVGGIETPADASARLDAGATLVQAYTGFIYAGPRFARRIALGLRR
jgi:dihydroorotate dehydrogenase